MSIHIGAKKGDIAGTILLPGDPMRAKFIAENFLEDIICYNEVRGMYGFTGTYKGKRISVQGTGMGMPSHSIYVNELITEYGVKNLIRVGSCGSMSEEIKIRDIILAMGACSNSKMNEIRFKGADFAPTANFDLLLKAYQAAGEKGIDVKVGNVLSSDFFYEDDPEGWKLWSKYGVLAVEMETAELYTLAARYGVNALAILTVSDSLVTGELTTSEEREQTFTDMIEIALELAE
ncbi:MAG: purine-nucleoside phosphorylase [Halanaerobiales bacterium]|jgi:purine-nucleoside phosphorylase|nr:purine-nucleoside phosphorylase [Bacillota bacterium]HOA40087.1 purine-nucleoside phosphorylase [Halanaerobiales bacterium]HPZ62202.1 purine-nucleoside phosphorylase [Halanaerobiales bacterium]HQD04709.1 purine-nucleoside phosphorylase [Halanaerobiales bacterium]